MTSSKYFALVGIGSAALMCSATALAQPAPPTGASPQPAPPTAQPLPPSGGAAVPTQPAAYPLAQAQPVPAYAAPAPAPTRPYAVYDPSTGQTMLMTPVLQRTPPRELPYSENRPIPRGYVLEEYHPRGLIISGAVTLGALWAISFTVASSNDFKSENGWLAVPVLGPFGWLATRKTPKCTTDYYYDNVCNSNESSNRTLVALDGIGQLAGAALLISGLAITRKHLVLVDPQAAVAVAPYASSHGSGLQLIGQF